MRFQYGIVGKYIDITDVVLNKNVVNGVVVFPTCDNERARMFGDPAYGHLKHILATDDDGNTVIIAVNNSGELPLTARFDMPRAREWWKLSGSKMYNTEDKLKALHAQLSLNGGSFDDEFPEQTMAMDYIKGDSKVLELGGNIGRNSLIIATILDRPENLVTMESSRQIANVLRNNADINNLQFNIESAALSKRRLIQRGWDTSPIEDGVGVPDGWHEVDTISFDDLKKKYAIEFDTLVCDCEGALYYILQDESGLLNNINTVIIENDFADGAHRNYVVNVLTQSGFKNVYRKGCHLQIVVEKFPSCVDCFYEVWQK